MAVRSVQREDRVGCPRLLRDAPGLGGGRPALGLRGKALRRCGRSCGVRRCGNEGQAQGGQRRILPVVSLSCVALSTRLLLCLFASYPPLLSLSPTRPRRTIPSFIRPFCQLPGTGRRRLAEPIFGRVDGTLSIAHNISGRVLLWEIVFPGAALKCWALAV